MTINDAIFRYNLLNSIIYVDGNYSLSRELKIKLIRYKLNFQKIYNEFNELQKTYMEEIKTEEYNTLVQKEDKTEEELKKLDEIVNLLNNDLNQLINSKLSENVETDWFIPLTEDEYNQILEVNVEHIVNINGTQLDGTTYVSLIHDFFC